MVIAPLARLMMSSRSAAIAFLSLLAAGCGGDTAEFGPPRSLPKERRPTVWDATPKQRLGLPDMRAPSAQGPKRYVAAAPAGWEELPPQPSRFRESLWRVAGVDGTECYVTAGVGGGVAQNMARWYGQFGVTSVPAIESLPVVEFAGRPARLVELTGTFGGKPAQGMLLAFFADGDAVTTLKFTGPESVVAGNRQKFLDLAQALRLATASPDPKAPPIEPGQPMPPGHPPTGAGGTAPPAQAPAPAAPFTATAPATWSSKTGTSRWLHHGFGADGEVYVGQLDGTLKPTLDIWRGEMGLSPMSDAEYEQLPQMAFLGEDSVLLDLAGNFQSMSGKQIPDARLLVAARSDGGAIVFVKLVGPAADVAAQVDAFRQFCASVRRAP